jgi:hypothetical protein
LDGPESAAQIEDVDAKGVDGMVDVEHELADVKGRRGLVVSPDRPGPFRRLGRPLDPAGSVREAIPTHLDVRWPNRDPWRGLKGELNDRCRPRAPAVV